MRSGTLPHPLVAGFGEACALALREMVRANPSTYPTPTRT